MNGYITMYPPSLPTVIDMASPWSPHMRQKRQIWLFLVIPGVAYCTKKPTTV